MLRIPRDRGYRVAIWLLVVVGCRVVVVGCVIKTAGEG
jgi:hypothetical protein